MVHGYMHALHYRYDIEVADRVHLIGRCRILMVYRYSRSQCMNEIDRHTQYDGIWSREWNSLIRAMRAGAVMFQTCIRSAWE
jgi:hypothetical protein